MTLNEKSATGVHRTFSNKKVQHRASLNKTLKICFLKVSGPHHQLSDSAHAHFLPISICFCLHKQIMILCLRGRILDDVKTRHVVGLKVLLVEVTADCFQCFTAAAVEAPVLLS